MNHYYTFETLLAKYLSQTFIRGYNRENEEERIKIIFPTIYIELDDVLRREKDQHPLIITQLGLTALVQSTLQRIEREKHSFTVLTWQNWLEIIREKRVTCTKKWAK